MFVVCSGGGVRHFQRPPFHRRRLRRRALAAARSCRRWCSSWQPWRPQVRALGERASRDRAIIFPQTEHGLLIAHLTSMLTDTSTPRGGDDSDSPSGGQGRLHHGGYRLPLDQGQGEQPVFKI